LDARNAISVTQRQAYIGAIRNMTKACAKVYLEALEPEIKNETAPVRG